MYVKQQPNGKWRVIVQVNATKRSAVTATRKEAVAVGAELMLELGQQAPANDMTLEDLLNLHLDQSDLAATTAEDCAAIMRKLPDWMKSWKSSAVTTMMLDQAYRRLGREGWPAHRIRKLHTIIHPAYKRAMRWGWVRSNPATDVEQPKKPKSTMDVPEPAAVMRILVEADRINPAFGCAMRVTATTGIRRGELCGLMWSDFDEERGELLVCRSVSTTTADAHGITDGKTSTKGHRVIGLGLPTVAALRAHRTRSKALAMERGLPLAEWIFTHDGVHPWRTDYVTLAFARLRNDLGLPSTLHPHSLRHFVATELLGSNMDPRTVAGRLGHARTSTTLDMYAAFLPARDREAADIMERRLEG